MSMEEMGSGSQSERWFSVAGLGTCRAIRTMWRTFWQSMQRWRETAENGVAVITSLRRRPKQSYRDSSAENEMRRIELQFGD